MRIGRLLAIGTRWLRWLRVLPRAKAVPIDPRTLLIGRLVTEDALQPDWVAAHLGAIDRAMDEPDPVRREAEIERLTAERVKSLSARSGLSPNEVKCALLDRVFLGLP